jgi:hypothetical protein
VGGSAEHAAPRDDDDDPVRLSFGSDASVIESVPDDRHCDFWAALDES